MAEDYGTKAAKHELAKQSSFNHAPGHITLNERGELFGYAAIGSDEPIDAFPGANLPPEWGETAVTAQERAQIQLTHFKTYGWAIKGEARVSKKFPGLGGIGEEDELLLLKRHDLSPQEVVHGEQVELLNHCHEKALPHTDDPNENNLMLAKNRLKLSSYNGTEALAVGCDPLTPIEDLRLNNGHLGAYVHNVTKPLIGLANDRVPFAAQAWRQVLTDNGISNMSFGDYVRSIDAVTPWGMLALHSNFGMGHVYDSESYTWKAPIEPLIDFSHVLGSNLNIMPLLATSGSLAFGTAVVHPRSGQLVRDVRQMLRFSLDSALPAEPVVDYDDWVHKAATAAENNMTHTVDRAAGVVANVDEHILAMHGTYRLRTRAGDAAETVVRVEGLETSSSADIVALDSRRALFKIYYMLSTEARANGRNVGKYFPWLSSLNEIDRLTLHDEFQAYGEESIMVKEIAKQNLLAIRHIEQEYPQTKDMKRMTQAAKFGIFQLLSRTEAQDPATFYKTGIGKLGDAVNNALRTGMPKDLVVRQIIQFQKDQSTEVVHHKGDVTQMYPEGWEEILDELIR